MPAVLSIVVLAFLFLLLYLFHRAIIKYFSLAAFTLFGRSSPAAYLYFLFFLPGVILHELSHLFTASILGVPTGRLTLFPQKTGEDNWSLGQVASAQTDVFRSSLIGLAPIIIGSISLILIATMGLGIKEMADVNKISLNLPTMVFLYLTLCFANTMFLSEEDRASIWAFPVLLGLLFFFGKAMGLAGPNFSPLILGLSLTVGVDLLFLLALALTTEVLVRFRG